MLYLMHKHILINEHIFIVVEPLHLYVKETSTSVTTQSTTPTIPDITVPLEGW